MIFLYRIGIARHASGAFSGKDHSKVDRYAAYAARYIAKNIVAVGLTDRYEIQIFYAIGIAKLISIMIKTFGTEKIENKILIDLVNEVFNLCSYRLIKILNLLQSIYLKTATYGHFSRIQFPWEKIDKVSELSSVITINEY